jgi:hypothetical protein
MEMPRGGKRGKPNGGFPSFPTALGNRNGGDFHIPTGATAGSPHTYPTPNQALRTDIDPKILAREGLDRL